MKSSLIVAYVFYLAVMFFPTTALGDDYVIINVETGMVLDVPGGSDAENVVIQQFDNNRTRAQAFEISTLSGPVLIKTRIGSELVLEAQSQIETQGELTTSGVFHGPKLLQRKEIFPDTSGANSVFELQAIRTRQNHQRWRFVSVDGEENTFFIQNAAYGDRRTLGVIGDGARAVARLVASGSDNHTRWRLDRLNQTAPAGMRLQTLKYGDGRVSGSLFWEDRSENETGYQITLRRESDGIVAEQLSLPAGSESIEFDFDVEDDGSEGQRHCISVSAQRAHYRLFEASNIACGFADKNPKPCGRWAASAEIITGSGVQGTALLTDAFTGCEVRGDKQLRIREDRSWWPDRKLLHRDVPGQPPYEIFYTCDSGENAGRVFTELKIDGKKIVRSPIDHDVANCG